MPRYKTVQTLELIGNLFMKFILNVPILPIDQKFSVISCFSLERYIMHVSRVITRNYPSQKISEIREE